MLRLQWNNSGVNRFATVALTLSALSAMAAAGAVRAAQEFCVTCSEPDAVYRCAVEGTTGTLGDSSRRQLLCITELARAHAHGSCSARRAADNTCLNLPLTTVRGANAVPGAVPAPMPIRTPQPLPAAPVDTAARPGPAAAPAQPAGAAPAAQPVEKPSKAKGPPETVEELAKRSAATTKKQLKKAGDTVSTAIKKTGQGVGNVAKKSWRCLSSLFQDC